MKRLFSRHAKKLVGIDEPGKGKIFVSYPVAKKYLAVAENLQETRLVEPSFPADLNMLRRTMIRGEDEIRRIRDRAERRSRPKGRRPVPA